MGQFMKLCKGRIFHASLKWCRHSRAYKLDIPVDSITVWVWIYIVNTKYQANNIHANQGSAKV